MITKNLAALLSPAPLGPPLGVLVVVLFLLASSPMNRPGLAAPQVNGLALSESGSATVSFWRLPAGSIQPQAVTDSNGDVHLIYYRSGPADGSGNLYYTKLARGQTVASPPVRVNSQENSAGCIGTVRTAHIAIGKGNRAHVVWNGLGPKGANGYAVAYQAYTRLNNAGTAFEPQRNLITWAQGVDGGGSVAADSTGNVYVAWHALANAKDEAGRAVFVSSSNDEGATFSKERQANPEPTGACGCCGLRALVDGSGDLYILYRSATNSVDRDTMLLVSRDKGKSFTQKRLDSWKINACPMSTYALAESRTGMLAAWETSGHVYWNTINSTGLTDSAPRQASGSSQKHPSIAAGPNGQTLLVWTEGTGWQRGGTLAWQVLDKDGTPVTAGRKADSIPVWGLPSAYSKPDGTFVIVY